MRHAVTASRAVQALEKRTAEQQNEIALLKARLKALERQNAAVTRVDRSWTRRNYAPLRKSWKSH